MLQVAETSVWGVDFTGPDIKPKINGPIGMSGWQSGPSIETSQQPPSVIWASGEYTKLIGADHQAIVSVKILTIKIIIVTLYFVILLN